MDVENGGEGGGVGGRVGGGRSWDRLREGRRERTGDKREEEVDIKYARTDAWSHSSLPFLPVSLFPILVPSKRSPLPVYLLFSRLSLSLFLFLYVSRDRLYPRMPSSLLLCVSRVRFPRKGLSRSAVFFLFVT